MENKSLISVIVPIYNSEKYLKQSIGSIIDQTYNNLEILLIDDCSSDLSSEICKRYAQNDKRIKYIRKEKNEGVSKARNLGLSIAKGEYIGFVDSDDICEPDLFELLYNALIQSSSDIAICMYNDYRNNKISKHIDPLRSGSFNKKQIIEEIISPMIGTPNSKPQCAPIMGSLWRCLFKKDTINISPEILFKKMRFAEDLQFIIEYLIRCDKAYVVGEYLYNYRSNPTSATHKYSKNMYSDIKKQLYYLKKTLVDNGLFDEKNKEYYYNTYIYNILWCISNESKKNNNRSFIGTIKQINILRNDITFNRVLTWRIIWNMSIKERMYVAAIKLRLYPIIILYNRR